MPLTTDAPTRGDHLTDEDRELLRRLDPDNEHAHERCVWLVEDGSACDRAATHEIYCRACGRRQPLCVQHTATWALAIAKLQRIMPALPMHCECGRHTHVGIIFDLFGLRPIGGGS